MRLSPGREPFRIPARMEGDARVWMLWAYLLEDGTLLGFAGTQEGAESISGLAGRAQLMDVREVLP